MPLNRTRDEVSVVAGGGFHDIHKGHEDVGRCGCWGAAGVGRMNLAPNGLGQWLGRKGVRCRRCPHARYLEIKSGPATGSGCIGGVLEMYLRNSIDMWDVEASTGEYLGGL